MTSSGTILRQADKFQIKLSNKKSSFDKLRNRPSTGSGIFKSKIKNKLSKIINTILHRSKEFGRSKKEVERNAVIITQSWV